MAMVRTGLADNLPRGQLSKTYSTIAKFKILKDLKGKKNKKKKKKKKIKKIINVHLQKQPPGVFHEKGVLRNFTKFIGKHLCQSLRPAALLKKRHSGTEVFL